MKDDRQEQMDTADLPLPPRRRRLRKVESPEMSTSDGRETDFAAFSYGMHETHEGNTIDDVPSLIAKPDTIDAWRHQRLHAFLTPLHDYYRSSIWLTVGDSASYAYYLRKRGLPHVIASSISSMKLERLKQDGHLHGAEILCIYFNI